MAARVGDIMRRRAKHVLGGIRLGALVAGLGGLTGCAGSNPPPHQACLASLELPDPQAPTAGMLRLDGGTFAMGASPEHSEEGPPRQVQVGDFWIDRTEVTNAAFARFVAATGHVTLAERPLDPATYPALTAAQRQPASLVFVGAGAAGGDPAACGRLGALVAAEIISHFGARPDTPLDRPAAAPGIAAPRIACSGLVAPGTTAATGRGEAGRRTRRSCDTARMARDAAYHAARERRG